MTFQKKTTDKFLLGICTGLAIAGLILPCQATEIKFVTEYRYPTAYEVIPIRTVDKNGRPKMGAITVPTDFETREVGVQMIVEAAAFHVAGVNGVVMHDNLINQNTKLMVASTAGNFKITKMLMAQGAPVNKQNRFGSTALMGAAAGGFDDIVNLLLKKKALVNKKSKNGSTALQFAAKNGHLSVVKSLLKSGASVNTANQDGLSPLMQAVTAGHADIVKELVRNNANVSFTANDGSTPLQVAQINKRQDIVILLTRQKRGK